MHSTDHRVHRKRALPLLTCWRILVTRSFTTGPKLVMDALINIVCSKENNLLHRTLQAATYKQILQIRQAITFDLDTVEISENEKTCEFQLDDEICKWRAVDEGEYRLVTVTMSGKSLDLREFLPMKNILSAIVSFYLNRPNTIDTLKIMNRPRGLEHCKSLSVRELQWHNASVSGNASGWLSKLEQDDLEIVEIHVTGDNNNILNHPVIIGANVLRIRNEKPLENETVLMFTGIKLILLNHIPSPDLLTEVVKAWTTGPLDIGRLIQSNVEGNQMRMQIMEFLVKNLGVEIIEEEKEMDIALLSLDDGSIEFTCTNERFIMEIVD